MSKQIAAIHVSILNASGYQAHKEISEWVNEQVNEMTTTVKAISQAWDDSAVYPWTHTTDTVLWEQGGMNIPGPGTFPQWGVIPNTEPQLLGSTDICDSP